MAESRKLPTREHVFVASLRYHGFRISQTGKNLKFRYGYIILVDIKEDSGGIDFLVKLPRCREIVPVQITQRGTKQYKKYRRSGQCDIESFEYKTIKRLRDKRQWCRECGIAFVLVRDYEGEKPNTVIAWGDKKALMYGIQQLQSA